MGPDMGVLRTNENAATDKNFALEDSRRKCNLGFGDAARYSTIKKCSKLPGRPFSLEYFLTII